jgi:hypothetical protein
MPRSSVTPHVREHGNGANSVRPTPHAQIDCPCRRSTLRSSTAHHNLLAVRNAASHEKAVGSSRLASLGE